MYISKGLIKYKIITFEPKTPAGHPKYEKTQFSPSFQ